MSVCEFVSAAGHPCMSTMFSGGPPTDLQRSSLLSVQRRCGRLLVRPCGLNKDKKEGNMSHVCTWEPLQGRGNLTPKHAASR